MGSRTLIRYAAPLLVSGTALCFPLLSTTNVSTAPQQGAAAPAQPAPGGARGSVGRGNAGATAFTENCSGCHGSPEVTGRAPQLFDQKWLDTTTDDRITDVIRHGKGQEMPAFPASQIPDEQIIQMLNYVRTATANLKPRPAYVADPAGEVITSDKQTFKLDVLTRDVNTPFGLAFLPDGRLLITERPGTLRILDKQGVLSAPVKGTPAPHVQQDGGLLAISVHPQYSKNGWIYLSYSEVVPGYVAPPADQAPPANAPGRGRGGVSQPPSNTVIVRGKLDRNNAWTDQQVIFRSRPDLYVTTGSHYGSRFIWDREGHLFFTLGERGDMQNAQQLTNTLGKIHRINDDGSTPKDNPFVGTPGADATIWSYGHRNPEGLAWDPVTGLLWESEHGPTGGDEINIIRKGHNYGWGVVSKGVQGGITKTSAPGMDDPVVYFTPSIAPAGIAFYTGARYPGWKNTSLFVTALVGQQLRRLEISGERVVTQEVLFDRFGRVRDIAQGPDGYFYLALQSPTGSQGLPLSAATPGMIVRLVPVSTPRTAAAK